MDDIHLSVTNIRVVDGQRVLSSEVTTFMRKLKSINESNQDES